MLSFPSSEDGGSAYVEAVPCNWLTPTKSHCRWPPYKNPLKVSKCLKASVVPGKDWTVSEARILKLCCKCLCLLLKIYISCSNVLSFETQ